MGPSRGKIHAQLSFEASSRSELDQSPGLEGLKRLGGTREPMRTENLEGIIVTRKEVEAS